MLSCPSLQLVMLGAGMDSRPWRMKLPAGEWSAVARWAGKSRSQLPGTGRLDLLQYW